MLNEEKKSSTPDARIAAIDLISQLMLEDPNIPEAVKLGIKLIDSCKEAADQLLKIANMYTSGMNEHEDLEKAQEIRSEVIEYIGLVRTGIDSFLSAHPVPEELKMK